ncbi:hypothetical protein ACP26L_28420 [Paenibacillus sp. S-38]|uniref:hypothetical protein n=1 Tax=Paenibacillus sp. S-38 TaxID=3416710 RepID=UPI003CF9E4E1
MEIWDSALSWQEKEAQYESMVKEVDQSLLETFSFEKAMKSIEHNQGMVVYSGKWALKTNADKEMLLGELMRDGTYSWMNPLYIPPILLGLTWGLKEKRGRSGSFFSRFFK